MIPQKSISRYIWIVLFSIIVGSITLIALNSRGDQSVTVEWDKNPEPDVNGYVVYYGNTSRNYPYSTNVGNVTTATIYGLSEGKTHYFAVTARNSIGLESDFSNELTNSIPDTVTNTAPTISVMIPMDVGQGRYGTAEFSVWDIETPPGELYVTATSSNPLVVPNSSIKVSGTNHNRSITIGKCPGIGETEISILVYDGGNYATSSFILTVNPVPNPPVVWMRTKYEVSSSPDGPWTNMASTVFPFVFDPKLFYKTW